MRHILFLSSLFLLSGAATTLQAQDRAATGVIHLLPSMRGPGLLLRTAPGYEQPISGKIAQGTFVLITERRGQWSRVSYAPGVPAADLAQVCRAGSCQNGWAENRFVQSSR